MEFSHVSYFVSKTKNPDGTETWRIFDGGQTFETSEGRKHGSRFSERIYYTKYNEITGEITQGRDVRWLQGWVSLDKRAQD